MRPNSNICRALKGTRLEEHSYPGDEAMNALEDRIEKERTIPLKKKSSDIYNLLFIMHIREEPYEMKISRTVL